MSIQTVEAKTVEAILNFTPRHTAGGFTSKVDLGEVGSGVRLVHDIFPFQKRVTIGLGHEPLTPDWTRQPVLALVRDEKFTTLAYATDIQGLDESLAQKILDRLETQKNKGY